jgi:TolB-like protein/class 3 adenylate cyclase
MTEVAGTSRILTLVFTDLAESTGLKRKRGDQAVGELIARHRGHVRRLAAESGGHVIDWAGDGCFLTFETPSVAVLFALRLQHAHGEEPDLPGVRTGIHMGEVSELPGPDGDVAHPRVEGLAVDLAARICGLARPAQVLMSSSVAYSARQRIGGDVLGQPIRWRTHGSYSLKGFDEALEIWEAGLQGMAPFVAPAASEKATPTRSPRSTAPVSKKLSIGVIATVVGVTIAVLAWWITSQPRGANRPAAPKGDGPIATIAVLPFVNQSGDPNRDYFSDGITEDIISALGRFSEVRVMAHNAVQPYKGRRATTKEISRDLDVRYLVQGSVREADGRARVGVELSDTAKGTELWSERYEGEGKQLFEIQDRIVKNIAGTLAVKLTVLEEQRVLSKAPESMEAYDLVLRARDLLGRFERVSNREARELAAKALQISPSYAEAYVVLAEAEYDRATMGWVEDPAEAVRRAEDAARRAIALDDPGASARAHGTLGNLYSLTANLDAALVEADLAIELNASDARAHSLRGGVLLWLGRIDESIASGEEARHFDPRLSWENGFNLAFAYYLAGRFRDAAATADVVAPRQPDNVFLAALRAAAYGQLGQAEEAQRAVETVRRLDPFFKVELFGKRLVNPAHRKLVQDGLRKVGL